jgi:histidyl-tRNA synthetase
VNLPFRRYQIAPVWRAEKPARGRFREFVQCDADIVGSRDMLADAELVTLSCELLSGLGVDDFVVRINNRKVLSGLMHRVGIRDGAHEAGVLRTVDKLPKIGREETMRLLEEENGLRGDQKASIFEFLDIGGETGSVLEKLRRYFGEEEPGRKGAEELARVFELVEGHSLQSHVELDLSIARGLNYYTGTIYEAFLGNLPGYGAVLGGGRYDGLIGIFKGQEIPGVGISLGIDRLLEGLVELGVLEEQATVARTCVTVFDEESAVYSASVAGVLRSAGIACELYPARQKIGKQFRHAERAGMQWVVVAGPDERARGEVAVKDLSTGRQETVPLDRLVDYLSGRLAGAP